MSDRPVLAVIGGGISGLAAAHELARTTSGAQVILIEADEHIGGNLRGAEVAGVQVDLGPESLLARVPWGLDLLEELGLADEAVAVADLGAHIFVRGALRPLPAGVMTGSANPKEVRRSGLLTRRGQLRAAMDLVLPGRQPQGDESIAHAIGARLGREAVKAIAEPLLGGIYAGDARRLSVRAAAPGIAAARARGGSLIRAMRVTAPPAGGGPVFISLPGGLARLPEAIAAGVRRAGGEIRLGTKVVSLTTRPGGVQIELGSGELLNADAAVLAAPAHSAADLVAAAAPEAAEAMAAVRHASVAVATLAFDPAELPPMPASSGFLVAAGEGLSISACTISTQKWPQLAPDGPTLLRCSLGKADEPPPADDRELLAAAGADLKRTLGIRAEPIDWLVARFEQSIPQHEVGHLDRIALIDWHMGRELPGVALAGAWRLGVGLSACIRDGRAAARQAMMSLQSQPTGA